MLRLELLGPADIPEVMRLERLPFCAGFVGSFERETHAAEMASPNSRYLGIRDRDLLAGFVLLQNFREPVIRLRRIVVAEPGQGTGTALLRALIGWVFANTPAAGMRLHVRAGNARARRLYLREGFRDRSHDEAGQHMAVTRAAWQALHQQGKA